MTSRPFNRVWLGVVIGLALSSAARAQGPYGAQAAVDAAVHDLCARRVAVLGEAPMHGFGRTLELKAMIVRRLVNDCGFGVFLIESGTYDFLNIASAVETGTVTEPMVSAAIGGLWATQEVQNLVPFLTVEAGRGRLVLGGLDDQLGRGTYAQLRMPDDLAGLIANDSARASCLAILERHTLYKYTADAPYGSSDRAHIRTCLDEAASGVAAMKPSRQADRDLSMIRNLRRTLARDSIAASSAGRQASFNDRDQSMYENFQWWLERAPRRAKVIVWTATTHGAKSLAGVPGSEETKPLGGYIRAALEKDAFMLGFSAESGSYAMGRQPPRALGPAPSNALERVALSGVTGDVQYVPLAELRRLGTRPARALGPDFKEANWSEVFDGVVVIREERPPQPIMAR